MDISYEIIVVHHTLQNGEKSHMIGDEGPEVANKNKTKISQTRIKKSDEPIHAYVQGRFGTAVLKGIEMSSGQSILVIDADFPYPEEVVCDVAKEITASPNSIIITSRYASPSSINRLPFVRSAISRGARIIVKHTLNVKDVKDPLSSCFAFSREHINGIHLQGMGDEILLEILVKVNSKRENKTVTVKEIPFRQKDLSTAKKLNFTRILSYSKAVLHLYCYGGQSMKIQSADEMEMRKRHKSVLFLSKAGRYFTVGASGFVVNYAVSFLLANIISNIWYIQATLFGIIISITTNFLLNKVWTFEDRDFSPRHFFRQYLFFLVLSGLGATIQVSLVFVFVEYSHIQYGVSLILAVSIPSIGNFLLNKKITFGEKI